MSHVTRSNDSAYPHRHFNDGQTHIHVGLTKREYFAAMAMQGIVQQPSYEVDFVARRALQYADALIAELNK